MSEDVFRREACFFSRADPLINRDRFPIIIRLRRRRRRPVSKMGTLTARNTYDERISAATARWPLSNWRDKKI